ncbi:unnamed protein product [Darwinula stevensoni]|uniref:Nop domain-containing protein n=1 Tax=Darwinula stevensoni TaxID=69355 RepID=A0A7R9A9S2_9CRUS|nr:unnamed protein product [Darwinula stevensoni]CAG0897718.1 unnamed protein product [Darwinula stevensoni]
MLVLFETPAGPTIPSQQLLDEKKLQQTDNLYLDFETPEKAAQVVKLKAFEKFKDTTDAMVATTAAVEGKMSKVLKKMLKKLVVKEAHEALAVADAKLGNAIKDKLGLECVSNSAVMELTRCIRSQMDGLITLPPRDITAMALGLAHSLSRYKLKFSPEKVDTMIVQAVSLLDDLDKELNNYIMRAKEWYGWHFPELAKIVTDNIAFIRTVKAIGMRKNTAETDLSEILPEEIEEKVKENAEISMGTEISKTDIENIIFLCDQVLEISDYRAQLYEYLKNRMMAIAPNLTVLVIEGSLLNLAKHPASTVQILGAEKALFRALKTRHDTPKYGLIYHAQLVGQAQARMKGKISRMLAAKAALACRVDALGEDIEGCALGVEHRAKVEFRIRQLEGGEIPTRISGTGKAKAKMQKYLQKTEIKGEYEVGADVTMKRKRASEGDGQEPRKPKKIKVEEIAVEVPPETAATPGREKDDPIFMTAAFQLFKLSSVEVLLE